MNWPITFNFTRQTNGFHGSIQFHFHWQTSLYEGKQTRCKLSQQTWLLSLLNVLPKSDIEKWCQQHMKSADVIKSCSHSGGRLATASGDSTVKIWDFTKAQCILTFTDHTHAVWGCSWHSCGDFLATCSMDCSGRIWDLNR